MSEEELKGFDALIAALTIFKKYENPSFPTHCEHDTLFVCVENSKVSDEDKKRLDELGFTPDGDSGYFVSYRFGSA